jgi:hypothetical protein
MPAATRHATRDATNFLTATPDEAALLIACSLTSAGDLLRLAAACRRFFTRCIAAPPPLCTAASGGTAAQQQAEMRSIAEEAARRWIATYTDQEQGWVPRRGRESWLGLMWEVEVLRRGAVFGRSHEEITLSAGGAVATKAVDYDTSIRSAASKVVMRAGRHYAQFTVVSGVYMYFGVIRPGWDVEGGRDAWSVDGHCFYATMNGRHHPGAHHWEGMQGAREQGDRTGLLLDLDQGTMTVYKNDERLGVMATGLSGEYSWAVALYKYGNSARIEATATPASATVEELAPVR